MPSYQRQHQNHRSQKPPSNQQTPPLQAPAQQEERSGFLGWMQDAGDWVANKYDAATDSVGEWVDGVTESAHNVIDVIQDTSINREDGKWNIDTDLDEVMDLIPTGALQLDREASENKVNIQIDRDKGEVRVRSASLAISGLNINGLQLSGGRLQDVELVITNASAHLPVIGNFTIGSEGQKSTATVNVGQIIGNNAVYTTKNIYNWKQT